MSIKPRAGCMMLSKNSNLKELHHILQITAESLYEAVMLIEVTPPKLYGESLSSCERCLFMMQRNFNKLKEEVIGVTQHGEK